MVHILTVELGRIDTIKLLFLHKAKLNPPYDVTVTNMSSTKLKITWHIPVGITVELHSKSVKYKLEYRWEGEIDTWTSFYKDTDKDIEVSGEIGLEDLEGLLHPYGLYYVRVKAQNTERNPTISSVFSVAEGRTSEIAPNDPPEEFHCKAEQDSQTRNVHLTWKALENPFKENGEILGYKISYRSSEMDKPQPQTVGPNDTELTVPGLATDQHYTFSIWTRNSMGTSKPETCSIAPVKPAPTDIGLVVGVCIGVIILIIIVVFIVQKITSSIRKFPDVLILLRVVTNNEYFTGDSNQTHVREAEVFDELIQHTLFVNLGPEEDNGGATFNGFDIGEKPRSSVGFQDPITRLDFESHPLLRRRGDLMLDDAPLSSDPLLPGPKREEYLSSGDEYCGACPSSPVSVGSGGSYLHIRDDDEINYTCMTREGLSPVEKSDIEGKRLRGERPTESVDKEEANLHSADADSSYTKMAGSLPSQRVSSGEGAGACWRDNQGGKPAPVRKKHPKETTVHTQPKREAADNARSGYVGDGSISNYVQQGFVPGTTSHDNAESAFVLPNNHAASYSQLGIQEEIGAAPLPSVIETDNRNQAAEILGPNDTYQRVGVFASPLSPSYERQEIPDNGDDNESDENPIGDIGSYVMSAGTLPDPLQIGLESDPASNHIGPQAGSPFREPVSRNINSEVRESVEGINDLQVARPLSIETLTDEEETLNYVTVGKDSDSLQQDNQTVQELDGYVTQGWMSDFPSPRQDTNNVGNSPAHGDVTSEYIDHEQLTSFPMPQSVPSPINDSRSQQMGATGNSGYVTPEQVLGIMSSGPATSSVNGLTPMNNNNFGTCGASDASISTNESEDDRGYAAQVNQIASNDEPTVDIVVNNATLSSPCSQDYVTTEQLATLPSSIPQPNFDNGDDNSDDEDDISYEKNNNIEHEPRDRGEPSVSADKHSDGQDNDGGYVTHDEMQNIASTTQNGMLG